MRKFVISALAAASILGAVSVANAQYVPVYPVYPVYPTYVYPTYPVYPVCNYVWNGVAWVNYCHY